MLRPLSQIIVLDGDLSDELEIILKLIAGLHMVVVEFHPGDVWIFRWTHSERGHAASIYIQGAVREEIEE